MIEVTGLRKSYGGRAVLDGIDLTVRPGELVALLGPNGAGKTTTVEIVEGYRRPDGGRVRVLGMEPSTGGPGLRARVGLMLQGGGIDPRARPRETIRQYGRFHTEPRDADELIDLLGLRPVASTRYRQLSGGERQRLGFALALVGRPDVVVLDEPTAGLDPEGRATMRSIVAGLRDDGLAILMTSHDLTDVERLADRIVVISAGRVVAAGTSLEIMARAGSAVRFRCARPLDANELEAIGRRGRGVAALAGVAVQSDGESGRYRLDVEAPLVPAAVAAIAAGAADVDVALAEVRTGGGTLEDAYLALVGREGAP